LSLRVANFKCFGGDAQGFERIAPFSIIIGRNNAGKSSLLDLLPFLTRHNFDIPETFWHGGESPKIYARSKMPEEVVRRVFKENSRSGTIPGNHWNFGKRYVDTVIEWLINTETQFVAIDDCADGSRPLDRVNDNGQYVERLAKAMPNPLAGLEFRRILAERNIVPEQNDDQLKVDGDGTGTTNIIQNFINKAALPSALVEETLLEHLNLVFSLDAEFTEFVCQQIDGGSWEIYL